MRYSTRSKRSLSYTKRLLYTSASSDHISPPFHPPALNGVYQGHSSFYDHTTQSWHSLRVENILNGTSEVEKVLFRDPSPDSGYLILPDMKWDLKTLSSLYLVAISFNRSIRSLRDLKKAHLPMLKSIRREGAKTVHERWGLTPGSLRMFIHYQPSYCAFCLSAWCAGA